MSGPVRGSHSLHLTFFPRKTMRGLERSQSMVATSVPFLCESSVLRLPLLEMVYSGRPAGSITTALRMLAPCLEILSSIEGRSSERGCLDQCRTQGGRRGSRPVIIVWMWVSACRWSGHTLRRNCEKRGEEVGDCGVRTVGLEC